jgi:anti-sigma factor RsiW
VNAPARARVVRAAAELAEALAELLGDAPAPRKSAPRRRRPRSAPAPVDVTDTDVAAARRALRRAGILAP